MKSKNVPGRYCCGLFFFFNVFYLLIFGCTESLLLGTGFLRLQWWRFLLAVHMLLLLLSTVSHTVVGSCPPRLSCSTAREIFPGQGSNPCPLPWQADSYQLDHQRSPVEIFSQLVSSVAQWCLTLQPQGL